MHAKPRLSARRDRHQLCRHQRLVVGQLLGIDCPPGAVAPAPTYPTTRNADSLSACMASTNCSATHRASGVLRPSPRCHKLDAQTSRRRDIELMAKANAGAQLCCWCSALMVRYFCSEPIGPSRPMRRPRSAPERILFFAFRILPRRPRAASYFAGVRSNASTIGLENLREGFYDNS